MSSPITVSDRRLIANRLNAQKSTGPRTPDGKAKSALNSLKHGLTARAPVLANEDPSEFLLFQDAMLEELNPLTVEQFNRAQPLIEVSWKLHRYRHAEAIVLQKDADSRTAAALRDWERKCEFITNQNLCKRRHERDPLPEKPSHQYTSEELLALSFFASGPSPLQLLDRYRSSLSASSANSPANTANSRNNKTKPPRQPTPPPQPLTTDH
jgi:hypothetical protein